MSDIVTCHFYAANITEYLPKFNIQELQNLFAGGNSYPIANEAKPFIDLTTDDGSNSSIVEEVTFQYDLEKTNGVIPRLTFNNRDEWEYLNGNDRDWYYTMPDTTALAGSTNRSRKTSFVKIDDISSGNPMENNFTYLFYTNFPYKTKGEPEYNLSLFVHILFPKSNAYLLPIYSSGQYPLCSINTYGDEAISGNTTHENVNVTVYDDLNGQIIEGTGQTINVGELICPPLNTYLCTYNNKSYFLRLLDQNIGFVDKLNTSQTQLNVPLKNHSVLRYTSQNLHVAGKNLNTTANNFTIYI